MPGRPRVGGPGAPPVRGPGRRVGYRIAMESLRPVRRATRWSSLALVAGLVVSMVPAGAGAASPDPTAGPVASSGPAPSASPIVLVPVEEPGYGVRSVAPEGWRAVGNGIRSRASSPTDPTLLALQSAPIPVDGLWPALLPQLGLTERPEPVDQRTTSAGLDWDLYQVPVGDTIADLALAGAPGLTYLVLLISPGSERDALVDAVFLPAVEALEPLVAERTPLPSDIGYTEQEVTLPGGDPSVTLAGTLTMPDGDGPHPALVLMSGSGPQDRDESLPGMTLKPFALVADALGRAGIAVLRYDDRGTAASTGDYASSTIADFTADGHAAFRWLREQPGIDPAQVGVLGHSEGGAYIATIAAEDPDVAFVIGLAPMVRSGLDLLIDQTGAIARTQGLDEAEIRELQRQMRQVYEAALGDDAAELERVLREVTGAQYDLLDPEMQALMGDREAYIELQATSQLPTLRSPWFQSILRADPSLDWAKVTVPVLAVFGDLDVQVIAEPEAAALEAALEAAGNDRGQVIRLPDANHLFQSAVTGGLDEYSVLDQTFTPDLLPRVDDWLAGVVER